MGQLCFATDLRTGQEITCAERNNMLQSRDSAAGQIGCQPIKHKYVKNREDIVLEKQIL